MLRYAPIVTLLLASRVLALSPSDLGEQSNAAEYSNTPIFAFELDVLPASDQIELESILPGSLHRVRVQFTNHTKSELL